jgi:hypothetical protein
MASLLVVEDLDVVEQLLLGDPVALETLCSMAGGGPAMTLSSTVADDSPENGGAPARM